MSLQGETSGLLERFRVAIERGRLGHAYLIIGDPRGGAGLLAEKIVQMLFCSGRPVPCGQCGGCRRAAERVHPDVFWIEPVKKSRGIVVEQVAALTGSILMTAFEGGWKAAVLVSADRMNRDAANKLLKTLEEPPPRTLFLLVSDQPEALLPTIVSRCQRVITGDSADEASSPWRDAVAGLARGMKDGAFRTRVESSAEMIAILRRAREEAEGEANAWLAKQHVGEEQPEDAKEMYEARLEAVYSEKRRHILRLLLLWQRDMLICACGLGNDQLFYRNEEKLIATRARELKVPELMDNIAIVERMQYGLDQYLPEGMVVERGFLQFRVGGQ